jgi:ABC-type cobalamin/Fe3+-siderophores transport system ATPase subunit
MLSDVRNYYGLARDFAPAGYFETEHSEQIVRELKLEIKTGKLLALSGIVGCGKTTILRRIQEALFQDKEILPRGQDNEPKASPGPRPPLEPAVSSLRDNSLKAKVARSHADKKFVGSWRGTKS